DVRTELTELYSKFGLHIDIQVQHGSCHRTYDDDTQQSGEGAAATHAHRAQQQRQEHRATEERSLHQAASPRSTMAGSNRNERLMAGALPRKVIAIASRSTNGSNTGSKWMRARNTARPMRCAINSPKTNPTIPATRASNAASHKKSPAITKLFAP